MGRVAHTYTALFTFRDHSQVGEGTGTGQYADWDRAHAASHSGVSVYGQCKVLRLRSRYYWNKKLSPPEYSTTRSQQEGPDGPLAIADGLHGMPLIRVQRRTPGGNDGANFGARRGAGTRLEVVVIRGFI